LSTDAQDAVLAGLESGEFKLDGVDGQAFFEQAIKDIQMGFFADPIYGGNRNKAGWAIIGFPGVIAVHRDHVAQYRGKPFPNKPVGIADMS